jgi:glycosyltransferase involved in cell wall biosynthesis
MNPSSAVPGGISVVFPAYNDGGTIASVVLAAQSALRKITPDFEILVVDDGSTDYTIEILSELEQCCPDLRVFRHGVNRGYGAALRTGFAAAAKEWIFYTDGDAQYNPLDLVRLAAARTDGVDVVNGYKTERQDPWYRRLTGFLYNQTAQLLFSLPIRDIDCDFRLFRRSLLDRVELESVRGTIGLEMIKKFQILGCRFREVPVSHMYRRYGRSQFFQVRRLTVSLYRMLLLYRKLILRRERTP